MIPASSKRLLLITIDTEENARKLARALVDHELAACVNIVSNVQSIYRYQGKVHEDPERLLIVKTSIERLPKVVRMVEELHPYEVPEMVTLAPDQVSPSYALWWEDQLGPPA